MEDPRVASPFGRVGAVIVAAGSSSRMRGVDKIFTPLAGMPLLAHAIGQFERSDVVATIVVVLSMKNLERGTSLAAEFGWRKVARFCLGGARRQDSVRAGLEALPECEWVLIHDGARPFLDEAMIVRGLKAAQDSGAAAAAVPVKDTIKVVDRNGFVRKTLAREDLRAIQTPQVFRRALILSACNAELADATDDACLVERIGGRVRLFEGAESNIKVTTPEDLALAEVLMASRERARNAI